MPLSPDSCLSSSKREKFRIEGEGRGTPLYVKGRRLSGIEGNIRGILGEHQGIIILGSSEMASDINGLAIVTIRD